MVLAIKMGTKSQEGARRRKPAITRKVLKWNDSDYGCPPTSKAAVEKSVRKPNVTRRILSSDSDSSESLPDSFINQPSTSRTPIDKPKNEKKRIGPTPNGDSKKKKNFVRPNGIIPSGSAGFSSERAINALTGVNNGFVYQLKKKEEQNIEEEAESDSTKDMKDIKKCNGSLVKSSLNEEIPEGTVIVQPEAAPDGEEDWYKSKEFGKLPRERRERKDASNQNASSTVDSVFCTACGTQVNPFDKKTFFCHPVLSVVICKACMEFYNSGPWKKDDDGIEEECRWCGEGGSLSCCDFCCKTFCKRCIMRNLGRAEWNRTLSKTKWECYVCEPSPLKELVAKCAALLSKPLKMEKKEKEKVKVNVQKKVVKAPKKEKKSLKMQDAAIAEEFLQYLVGNVSNRALFMKSLVRLKKEVPDMQKLQMNLSLKHIGEVMSVLGEFEACVKRQLYGDVHKSDSALDGTDPEDFDSPERKSKSQVERTGMKAGAKDEPAGGDKMTKQESAMDTAEVDEGEEADISQQESSVDDVGDFENEADAMDIDDTKPNQPSKKRHELKEKDEKVSENGPTPDFHIEVNGGDDETNEDQKAREDVTKGKDLKEEDQVESCAKIESKLKLMGVKQENDSPKEAKRNALEETGNGDSEDAECPSSQHSARKMKVTPRSPRSRRESQGASHRGSQASKSEEDKEAKLMSMIDESDDDSSEDSEGSDYTPKKSTRSSKKSPEKSPAKAKAKKGLFKEFVKEDPLSSAASDHEETAKRREGPGQDSSNPEGESGYDGIPGESSTELSQDEEREKEEKSKDSSSTVARKSMHSSGSSESESSEDKSESKSENSDDNAKLHSSKRMQRKSRNRLSRKKNKPESDEMDSASDEEMELQRLEGLGGLKRKRNHGTDSDDASENVHDASNMPEEGEADNVVKKNVEKKDVEERSESEENLSKKAKKVRKSPAKVDPKSREILSSDSSDDDDESDAESDGCSGLRWKSLNKKGKKKVRSQEVAENLLMEELDGDDEEDDSDEDDDENDEDEEMDGAGSKRSKKKAQKKAEEEEPEEEDEDWENGESRQNGTGGGGSGDGKKGGDDKDEKGKDQQDDDDKEENEEDPEENGEEEDEEDESDEEVGTKKSHPLLRVHISASSEEEDEDTADKKKGKKGKAAPRKKGKAAGKKKKKEIDTDDYFTSSESDDLSDEKPKRKRVTRSQTASSTEDSSIELKKPRKRAKKEHNTSSEADSSKETKPKKRGGRGKGKKRRRIKLVSDSDTEDESKTQEDSQEEKPGTGESSGDENDTPRKGRKQIRRVLKKSKLQAETLAAEIEEQERRKRIEQKRKEIISEEEEKAEKSAVVKSCILEKSKDSDEVLLEVDERIVANLKPHQAEGIQFMFDSTFESISKAEEKGGGCILAHCMGLGKTLQVIAYLHTIMTNDDLTVKTCLVVAPLNTVLNWEDEFDKWIGHLESGINVYEMSSVKNNSSRADYLDHWHKKGGVMIMGYAMYRNLSLLTHIRKKKEKAIFLKTLVDPGPDIVVCDEGHMLKNESSAISKAMNNITTLRRICLTGTPLQNNLIEYHCMVHFVKPNLLGTMREFKNRFVNPITNGQHSDSTARDVKIMKRRAHVLHNLLSGCVQRKDYTALTKFLPPKHEFVISVRLSDVQIKLYEHYLNTQSGRKDDGTKTQCTSLFADYQSLMNVWTHPRLLQLATQREDRNAAKRDMDDFVTSEEEDDDDDSVKAFVVSSDSDLDDPWKSSSKKKSDRSSSNSPRPRPSRRGRANSDSDDDDLSGEANNDGNNSDSSVEVVKSWNTRSRAKEAGLSEGASTSAADFFIPPEPEKVNKWYSDFFSEDDAFKVELSGKLVLLFEIVKMAESVGEKVLVFSQSLLSLDMIEDMLSHLDEKAQEERANGEQDLDSQIGGAGSWIKGEDYFRMDGSTPAHLRRRWSEIFNDLENIRARLFLISTRAGSLGTNLIAANRVIIFDANWNPSHDIQSIFRVYRFGQERAVFIYRFIAQGTMEEKIYDRQVIKQSLSQRVVDEHQIERHFTSADLSELYNFTPDRLDDPNRPERPTPVLPKDFFLAELLKTQSAWIVKYHEHDSLLENQMEEELTEEERKEAWKDYDNEKNRQFNMPYKQYDPQDMEKIYKEGESILRMGEMMLNYPGQSGSVMVGNNVGHPSLPMGGPTMGLPQATHVQRLLEIQSMYRAQMQQQQRQQQLQREQQQQLQRMMMLRQANSSSSSANMRHLQQIAVMQQQQQQQQQQRQQQQRLQQELMKQRQQNASSSEGKAP